MDTPDGAGAAGSTHGHAPADEHAGGDDLTEHSGTDSQVEESQDDGDYAPFLYSMPGAYIDDDDEDDGDDMDEEDDDFVDEEDEDDEDGVDDMEDDVFGEEYNPVQQILGLLRGNAPWHSFIPYLG